MAHEFVGVAQAFRIEHVVIVNHHGIAQVAAQTQAVCAHHFHFLHEAEGAGAGDFFHIRCAGEIDFKGRIAAVEHGVVEIDGEADFKAIIRGEAYPFARLLYFHRLQNTQEAFFGFLIHDARVLQQI